MDRVHKFSKVALAAVLGAFFGLGIFVFAGQHIFRNFYTPYIVQSGSMEPALPLGSLVLVKPKSFYGVNEVITFTQNSSKDLVTHRITDISYPAGTRRFPLYQTRGDANDDPDPTAIQINQVVGSVRFLLPYAGYAVDFAKTPQGFILFVIIPATIIVYEELKSVRSEIGKMIRKFGKRAKNISDINVEIGIAAPNIMPEQESILIPAHIAAQSEAGRPAIHRSIPKWAVLLPIAGASFILTAATSALLLDQETSSTNTLDVATEYSPPITAISVNGLDRNGQQVNVPAEATPAVAPVPTNLKISEVYYSPDAGHTINGSESESEWIEIHNPTANAIALGGLSIKDSSSCDDIPGSGILSPGGLAILGRATRSAFETVWQIPAETLFVTFAGNLGDGLQSTDEVTLRSTGCTQAGEDLHFVNWTQDQSVQQTLPTPGEL